MHLDRSNQLLDRLSTETRAAVLPCCHRATLECGTIVVQTSEITEHVYFVESGFLSVVAGDGHDKGLEVGLIGREGMLGCWLTLGRETAPFRVLAQSTVTARRMTAGAFRRACAEQAELQRAVLAYSQDFTAMLAETCCASVRLTVEGRVARWLLMAHERLDGDELSITHDALSKMLGVRRPGVTVALHVLEGEHMLKATRGTIRILDREKLSAAAHVSF